MDTIWSFLAEKEAANAHVKCHIVGNAMVRLKIDEILCICSQDIEQIRSFGIHQKP